MHRLKLKPYTLLTYGIIALSLPAVCHGESIIIDHNCAFLEPIPEWAVLQARNALHIAYGHTSHGSQLTEGMSALAVQDENLVGWKGDIYCWGYYWEPGSFECIDLHDYFRPGDLGHNGDTQWADATRDYLDNDPYSGDINVVIWSWCGGVSDNTPEGIQIYLDEMTSLEAEYPDVHFVYMTGHRDIWANETLTQNNQQIRDYCLANEKILYDFADIESYDPDGTYYEFVNDNCNYYDNQLNYLGNWAIEWQDSHVEGVDWFDCSAAHTQPLNGNRKAYAAWWLWCRIAGWAGPGTSIQVSISMENDSVALDWNPVPGALFYRIYSSDLAWGSFTEDLSGEFDGTSWTATCAESLRFYRVTAELE